MQPVHVDAVLADMRKLLERLAGPNVELVVESEPGLPGVRFNAAVLRQMLVELARAVGEAMPDGGRISVRASAGAAGVELSVRPGTESELATVFGLAVPNGADVRVEPTDDGGSKLSIYLPVWA